MSQGLPGAWLFSWHAQAPLFPRVNRIVRVKHRLASEKINAIATKLRIMQAFSGQFWRKRGSLDGEFPSWCPFSAFDQGCVIISTISNELSRPLNPSGVPLSGLVSIKWGTSSLFSGIIPAILVVASLADALLARHAIFLPQRDVC